MHGSGPPIKSNVPPTIEEGNEDDQGVTGVIVVLALDEFSGYAPDSQERMGLWSTR
jgi:hypothetical protein